MAVSVALRGDFTASWVRKLARQSKNGPQTRRLLALAAIYDGATRSQAAEIGGVTVQIVRDWVLKFNSAGAAGLIDRKLPSPPCRLNDRHRAALMEMIELGLVPVVHGVVRWRLIDLCQWIFEEFHITVAKQTLSRELRAMGYRKLSARLPPLPQQAQHLIGQHDVAVFAALGPGSSPGQALDHANDVLA